MITTAFHAALFHNVLLVYLVGLNSIRDTQQQLNIAWRLGLAVCLISILSMPINYIVTHTLLITFDLMYLAVLIYLLNIFLIIQVCEHFLSRLFPIYQTNLSALSALMLLSPILLAVTIVGLDNARTLTAAVGYGIGAGLGFLLVMIMVACLQTRISNEQIPTLFRGLPILLITLGIVAMAANGLNGMLTN